MGRRRGQPKQTTTIRLPESLHQAITAEANAQRYPTTINDVMVDALAEHTQRKRHLATSHLAHMANDLWDVSRMKLSNYYQILALEIKMAQMRRQVLEITGRDMRDYLTPEFQSPGLQTEIMMDLGAEDLCCAISNTTLWQSPLNSDLYLNAQEGAMRRGMKLRRVFTLACEDFGPGFEALKAMVGQQMKIREKFGDSADIRYRDLRKSGRHAISETYGSCNIIRRMDATNEEWRHDEGCMVVTPRFTICGDVPGLTLAFSEESGLKNSETRFYINRFDTATQGSKPIEELAQEIGLRSSELSLQTAGL